MSEEIYSREHIGALIEAAQRGDGAASEILARENLPLIKSLVRRFIGRGVDYDDLIQIGYIGFMKAVNGYRESYGVRFSTYAVPLILGELRRCMRDEGALRVSRSLKELNFRARRTAQALCIRLGREPSVQEIAAELGCELDDLLEALDAATAPVSLEQPYGNREGAREDLLRDHIPSPERMDAVDRLLLRETLLNLPPQERKIIVLRYFKSLTQAKVAQALGLTQVQVSRIENRVLKKLRCRLR